MQTSDHMRNSSLSFLSTRVCRFWSAVLFLFVSLPLSAHPGHDLGSYGARHIVTSPYHLGLLVTLGILMWWLGRFIRHRIGRRCAQIAGAVIALGGALLWMSGI